MNVPDNKQSENHDESFRDSITTINKEGDRAWIFPTKPKGKYYDFRTYFTWLYLVVLFVTPFIKYNGEPLFLFNVAEKKFILFGAIFWPQDFFYLWFRNAHLYCFHCLIYSCIWKIILWLGLSSNNFHGNDFS